VAAKENKKILIAPKEGSHLPFLDITHKVTAESFGGAFTIIEAHLTPGRMIPPHTHTREDECNFVLEGELTLDVGGEIVVAPAGSFVIKPRGVYHALCNASTEPVRFLEIHTPGEFENYDEYEEIGESAMDEEARRMARAELGKRYGVSWHAERITEAMARFGIGPSAHRSAGSRRSF
jgi:mannose-6-phosphate isomerase-like protein (cupin superfamily)